MAKNIKTQIQKTLILILLVAITIVPVQAQTKEERVIINSQDWTDVYSGVLYANLKGYPNYFLTSPRSATLLPYQIPKTVNKITIITSRDKPFASGYKALLEIEGYKEVEEIRQANLNIELAKMLPEINKFIVIDDSYGYNSISVAPYAALGKYYVLFADRGNIGQVENFLQSRTVNEIIIYGQVDRQVKTRLEQFNPIIINTGDRFDDNIEIVKRYQTLHKQLKGEERRQAILNNGEFIESSLMSGSDPVLFIGFSNVPEQVRNYISTSNLEVGTLVGNELIGTATFIRRQTGLSVFVKFGQGSRTPQNTIAQVEDLDRFPIPRYGLNLAVVAATLNTATNNLEITYQNRAPIGTHFRAISFLLIDGTTTHTIQDDETINFVDANDYKTILYQVKDVDGNDIQLESQQLSAQITTIYGESPKSLEQTLITNVSIQRISILDEADIEIVDASYQKSGSKFLVKIKNIGAVDAYVAIEIPDVYVNGEYLIFTSSEPVMIKPGKTKTIPVSTTMENEDIIENPEVKIRALFGERETALTKQKQATFAFKFAAMDFTIYIIPLLLLILLFLILFKKKCKNCGTKNPIGKKHCKKCGHRL